MSQVTKIKLIYAVVFPITMYRWEHCTMKKAYRKKGDLYVVLEENFVDTMDCRKDE